MKYCIEPKVINEYGFCNESGCQSKRCNAYNVDIKDGFEIHITCKGKTK